MTGPMMGVMLALANRDEYCLMSPLLRLPDWTMDAVFEVWCCRMLAICPLPVCVTVEVP